MSEATPLVCSRFHRAVELIGSRWTGAIIQTLLKGPVRYATIKSAIPDITDRMLSERLRSLESEDVLIRRVLPDSPIRVEYELTSKGSALQKALHEIAAWAETWIPANASATDSEKGASASQGRTVTRRTKTA
jgi:DNA-binding HxlR family transcriptional regulator